MARQIQDHYFRQAKRAGYLSRAAYKLIEIDDRKKLLRRGDRVLDCGAAPGSWLQVAAQRVGPEGFVVGIDPLPITDAGQGNVRCLQGDLGEIPEADLLRAAGGAHPGGGERRFDVLLSDMAPNTSGDHTADHHRSVRLCHLVLDRCASLLRPGGHLVMKVFEGQSYPELLDRTRHMFERVKGFVPKASRQKSTEIYVVARSYRGEESDMLPPAGRQEAAPPPWRRPSLGLGSSTGPGLPK